MPDAAATAIAHPRIHNGRPMQKSTTAEIAEVSGDAPKGHRVDFATYRNRARPQLVKTLIATVERFTDSGNAPRTDIGGLDVLATTTGRSKGSEGADRVAPHLRSSICRGSLSKPRDASALAEQPSRRVR